MEASTGSGERRVGPVPPTPEAVTQTLMCRPSRSTGAEEGATRATQAVPSDIEVPPSLEVVEVVASMATKERQMPQAATGATAAHLATSMPPSSTTSSSVTLFAATTPGVDKVSIAVLSNATVTLDPALAKRMAEFAIQPCDRQERSGK